MYLHKDKTLFNQAVLAASNYFKIDPSIVEKDYYITIFLKQLSQHLPTLLFKGGTSLSKCYKIINRFSEDLDITLTYTIPKMEMQHSPKTVCNILQKSVARNKPLQRDLRGFFASNFQLQLG